MSSDNLLSYNSIDSITSEKDNNNDLSIKDSYEYADSLNLSDVDTNDHDFDKIDSSRTTLFILLIFISFLFSILPLIFMNLVVYEVNV